MQGAELRLGRSLPGRGAWLCPDLTCLDSAIRRKAIPRALRVEIGTPQIDALRAAFVEWIGAARG